MSFSTLDYALIIPTLSDLVTILGGTVAIGVFIWQLRLHKQLTESETKIKAKQDEIDSIPEKVHGTANQSPAPIAQPTRDKLIEKEQKPLIHELELLDRDRGFILNKLLFTKK